jgi:DNA-directed RNA polymerase specialized sigma24 family protein
VTNGLPFDPDTEIGGAQHRFPVTRPSLIAAAGAPGALAREAQEAVATLYWKPAYKYVRLQWHRSNEEAKDLIQSFFAALLEQDILAKFDPAKATFRGYLKGCIDRFVMKQDEFAGRAKRGGGATELDFDAADRELAAGGDSAEDIFLREWKREMFSLAINDLRILTERRGKQLPFTIFEEYDLCDGHRPGYADLAARHGIAVTSVTNHLAWARRELRRLVLERLASVTSGERECLEESRVLFD